MEGVSTVFLEYGLIGAILVVLAWAYWQERKSKEEIQEKRLEEALATRDALSDFTSSIETLTEVIKAQRPQGGA